MPNHVTHVCTVTGSPADVERFIATHIRQMPDEGESKPMEFAFETIVPKPTIVDQTESGSEADLGLWALTGLHHQTFAGLGGSPILPHGFPVDGKTVVHHQQVRDWLEQHQPRVLEKGRLVLQCLRETGHMSWYEWSLANWGTKWGAYQYKERGANFGRSLGAFVFEFQTAWSFPLPIFAKLVSMYPELTFDVVSIDEGGPEFVGKFSRDTACYDKVPHDRDRYRYVYGREPEEDDPFEDEESEEPEVVS